MAETERIRRPDVPNVADDAKRTLNSVPAFLAQHVEAFLRMEGIETETWTWHQIEQGLAPLDANQACEGLHEFDDAGIVAIVPYVIESPLTQEQMTLLCKQMFVSEWYARREVWGDNVNIPNDMKIKVFESMTKPKRKMSQQQQTWALSCRKNLIERAMH